jgi:predicted ribosomally synthesized peptide with SipW-like signal peptide
MPARAVSVSQSKRPGKVRALLASGLVLGVGAAFTLAAWTDNEWVFGGAGPGNDTPGTKTYAMEQNTLAPFAEASWTNEPEANGGGLDFTIAAASMLPGDTVYAPFQLRAQAGSEALTVTLAEARQASPVVEPTNSTALYSALVYRAWVGVNAANCTPSGIKPASTDLVGSDVDGSQPLNTLGARSFNLPAGVSSTAAGAPVNLCFAMTLPADAPATLQGKNMVPLWRFTSSVGQ